MESFSREKKGTIHKGRGGWENAKKGKRHRRGTKISRVRKKVLPRKVFNWEKLFLFMFVYAFFDHRFFLHAPVFVSPLQRSHFVSQTVPFDSYRKKKEKPFCSMTISVSHFETNKQMNKQTNDTNNWKGRTKRQQISLQRRVIRSLRQEKEAK